MGKFSYPLPNYIPSDVATDIPDKDPAEESPQIPAIGSSSTLAMPSPTVPGHKSHHGNGHHRRFIFSSILDLREGLGFLLLVVRPPLDFENFGVGVGLTRPHCLFFKLNHCIYIVIV